MALKNQIKAGAALSYISLLLGNAIALFYTPFMLRSLGQSEFGLFSLANAVVGYLAVLDFGFGSATVRYTARYKAERQMERVRYMYGMFIVLYLFIGLITFAIGFCFSLAAENLFKGLSLAEIRTVKILLVLASINLAISFPLGVFTSIITAYERFIFLKVSAIVRHILNPCVYVPLLFMRQKSVALIIAASVMNVSFLVMNLLYCFLRLHIRISFRKFDTLFLKEIMGYSFWIFVGSIVGRLWWNSGQFLLGVFSSSVAIAIYGLAMQFMSYFESFATAISGVFLPRMTSMEYRNASGKDFTDYFIKVGRIQFIIIALITSGFILFGRQFIYCWVGRDYAQAYFVTIIIFIPLSLVDTQTLGITILQAKNRHKFRSVIYLCVTLICVILCVPFIKIYGVYGCAFATALALTLGNLIVMNWYYYKRIGLDIIRFWQEMLRILVPVLVLALASYFILRLIPELVSYSTLLPAILVYAAVYFIVMYFFSFNEYEKSLVRKIKFYGIRRTS